MKKIIVKGFVKMNEVKEKFVSKLRNQDGQTGGEYGAILVLVLVVAIPLLVLFRDEVNNVMQKITNSLKTR